MPVERYGEAVRLVAHGLNQIQRGRVAVQHDRRVSARKPDLLQPFRQAEHRDIRASRQHRAPREKQLLRAAVDEDQIGQIAEAGVRVLLMLGQAAAKAPSEHLLHRRKVVRADDGLDFEMPVLLALS